MRKPVLARGTTTDTRMTNAFPPTPPDFDPGPHDAYGATSVLVEGGKWSPAAIIGFVLSLIGCTVVGAVLGLVFGVFGIVGCRGGRRKGMGLAIAAIPISVVTGVLGVVVGIAIWSLSGLLQSANQDLPIILGAEGSSLETSTARLKGYLSESARAAVSDTAILSDWLGAVRSEHGTMVSIRLSAQSGFRPDNAGNFLIYFDGQFINGQATILAVYDGDTIMSQPRILNLEVGGSTFLDRLPTGAK